LRSPSIILLRKKIKITASAISLNVDDVTASATFVKQYFGFSEQMSADGFVSLAREDAGFNLVSTWFF
jgi:hypothetical protein